MKSHSVGAYVVAAVLVSALAIALAGPALASDPPGNNGTVKIHDGAGEPNPEVRNQPHVCTFHLHFFFGDAHQAGNWEIQRWAPTGPKGQVAMTGTYNDTDGDGEDREPNSGAYSLANGHYKLFWDGDTGKHDKMKVFWVKCPPAQGPTPTPTPPTQPTPTPTPPGGGATPTPTPPGGGATPTPTPAGGGATPTPTPAGGGATPTPTPAGNVGGATPTPTPQGAVGGDTAEPTLPPTNTLESSNQPVGNIPVVLLVLVAIGSIVIGATVLRPRPVRTRR